MTTKDSVSPEFIRRVPIFSSCSEEVVERIGALLERVRVSAAEPVFREGDESADLYVVGSGQLRVVSDAATEKVVFSHLAPGEFFGEMALITGAPRSAAVIATTDSELWRLTKSDFEAVQTQHPEIAVEISRILGERLRRGNFQQFQNEAVTLLTLTPERRELTIGRLPDNDLILNDPQVAGIHARVKNMDDRWVIYDEDTDLGTFVNRRRVKVAELADGDEILIGTNKVFLDGATVKTFSGREGVRIDALHLTRELKDGRRIVNDISLSIMPGEFVAIVGGSGAGKTSLLHALNGFIPATSGSVRYNGIDLYENIHLYRPVLGYVPQDDIVHGELTVNRTLYYAAKLRLPADMRPEEVEARIDEVLSAVGLSEHRATEVRRLSGGQRKRVSVALELLARPRALYLDEPTSGLDPALEGRMMALFRDLAASGATVIVSTHVTQNLRMCDKVIWMAPGGHLVFFGSPAEALRHFRVQEFGEIYALLDTAEERERWAVAFKESPAYRLNVQERLEPESTEPAEKPVEAAGRAAPLHDRKVGSLRQLLWLTVRYAEVLARDGPNLALLLLQAPAIGLAVLLLFTTDIFALTPEAGGDALRATMSLHILTASAIFLGASNAAREITKESSIYARERLVNLNVLPYVISKVIVLSALCLFQAVVLVAIFVGRLDLPGSDWGLYPQLLAAIFLTEVVGLAMGLLISAVSTNSDRAMAIVPVSLIPQLVFAGALVAYDKMLAPAKIVSQLMISKWALQLTGNMTNLSERFVAQFPSSFGGPYANQFDGATWPPWIVLAALFLVMLAATVLVQKRKDVL